MTCQASIVERIYPVDHILFFDLCLQERLKFGIIVGCVFKTRDGFEFVADRLIKLDIIPA